MALPSQLAVCAPIGTRGPAPGALPLCPPQPHRLPRALTASGRGAFFQLAGAAALFARRRTFAAARRGDSAAVRFERAARED
jgi:hypothetical protein